MFFDNQLAAQAWRCILEARTLDGLATKTFDALRYQAHHRLPQSKPVQVLREARFLYG